MLDVPTRQRQLLGTTNGAPARRAIRSLLWATVSAPIIGATPVRLSRAYDDDRRMRTVGGQEWHVYIIIINNGSSAYTDVSI